LAGAGSSGIRFRSSWRRKVAEAVYNTVRDLNDAGVHRFTVRQLFYQLVSRGVFQSTKQNYKNFDALLVRLREDDPWLDSMFIDTSKPRFDFYMESFWAGQKYFPELWIEKDALRGFFEPYARRYKVNLVVCRGYPSVTRLREAKEQRHVPPDVRYVILYFGDWDPSVTGDTPILCREGNRIYVDEMRNVVARLIDNHDIEVLSLNLETMTVEFRKVKSAYIHPSNNIYLVKYTGGFIKLTGNHSVYVLTPSGELIIKGASELRKGDFLVTICDSVLPASRIVLEVPQINRMRKKLPRKVILDRGLSKLLGYYVAEGYVKRQYGKPVGVCFCFSSAENNRIAEVDFLMKKVFGIAPTKREPRLFMSVPLAILFESLFKGTKAPEKRLPEPLWYAGRDVVMSFLRGYVGGDGYVRPEGRREKGEWIITTRSKWLAVGLNWLCRLKGIPSRLHTVYQRTHVSKKIGLVKGGLTWYVSIPASFTRGLKTTPKCLQIPNVFKEVRFPRPRNSWLRGMRTDLWRVINKRNARKIASVVDLDEHKLRLVNSALGIAVVEDVRKLETTELVYDISVEGNENFFGGVTPILLHNSGVDIFRWINEELKPYNIEVNKVALTREQVRKYKLPPMIPKKSDPRYKKYVKKYGEVVVELDALHPAVLRDIIRKSILKYMDVHKRLEVEVAEGIGLEAYKVVDEVLRNIRRRLEAVAIKKIREEVNLILPKVYQKLLEALQCGEELRLEGLYSREAVMQLVKEELKKVM